MSNQCLRVLDYIKDCGSITQKDAIDDLGIYRLASRIADLKKDGFDIKKEMTKVTNRYGETCHIARYFLNVE